MYAMPKSTILLALIVVLFFSCTREPVKPVVNNGIFLNEVAAKGSDWLEIYNAGTTAVNVGGMYLTDSLANPFKYRIPETDAARTTIQPGKYLVFFADEQGSQGILHANFRLNQLGEELGLFYIDGRTIDTRKFSLQNSDQSEGRSPDGGSGWKKMTPTPGLKNN